MTSDPTTLLGVALTSGVQLAYLTNDTKAAIDRFAGVGIDPWVTREASLVLREGPEDASPGCDLLASFAYMSGRMFELIEPLGEALPIFPALPKDELSITPHHVGAFMEDADEVVAAAKAADLTYHRFHGGRGDIVFVDTRHVVGHWLEALCFPDQSPR